MPTARAQAAYRFLIAHNQFYRHYQDLQKNRLATQASMNISSYDLFIMYSGIECAMFPHLYPTTDFTDTGILQHYKHQHGDETNRVLSIGLSWTRKVLSSVRVYGEQCDLPFFLYEKQLANKYFNAQVRAKRMNVTGDVMTRDSQSSTGYWETQGFRIVPLQEYLAALPSPSPNPFTPSPAQARAPAAATPHLAQARASAKATKPKLKPRPKQKPKSQAQAQAHAQAQATKPKPKPPSPSPSHQAQAQAQAQAQPKQ